MTQETPEIAGNKIGWFQGRLYEATIIAQYGGTLVTIKVRKRPWFIAWIRNLKLSK